MLSVIYGKKNPEEELVENIKIVDKVKIVGIFFSNEKCASELKENWEGRIQKIKSIIKNWMKRKLTIIGKIQVVKTYILSQLVYILQSLILPDVILNEINTILYRFLWKKNNLDTKAWERVKRSVLSNDRKFGGLDMINLIDFQKSFLILWAGKLCDEKDEEWKIIPKNFFKGVGGSSVFDSNIDFKDFKGFHEIKSIFWRKVLQIWLENKQIKHHITLNDTISNNKNLTLNNNALFIKTAIDNNILYIKDVLVDQQIISYDNYKMKITGVRECLIDYITMKTAISKIKDKILITMNLPQRKLFKGFDVSNANRKRIYQSFLSQESCYCETFWVRKFNITLNESRWENLFRFVKETKLQEIQWKILHNIFPTNVILNRMGIKNSEKCDHCEEKDHLEHYFYNCLKIKHLWTTVNQMITNKINRIIKLNEQIILLGIEQDKMYGELNIHEIKYIKNVILVGKLSIIKSKVDNIRVGLIFEKEISLRKIDT